MEVHQIFLQEFQGYIVAHIPWYNVWDHIAQIGGFNPDEEEIIRASGRDREITRELLKFLKRSPSRLFDAFLEGVEKNCSSNVKRDVNEKIQEIKARPTNIHTQPTKGP